MRYILLFIIITLYVLFISGLSFLILPNYGELWGGVLAFISILLAMLLGDKFILEILHAKSIKDNSKIFTIFKNFCFQQGLAEGNLYFSSKLTNNIVVVDSFFSKNFCVVVSENLEEVLNENELRSMIFGALDEVSGHSARTNLIFVEILFLCYFPLLVFQKVLKGKFFIFYPILSFMFFPLFGIQNMIFNKKEYFQKEILFENLTDLSYVEFSSGLLKLKEKSAFSCQITLIHKLIYNLAIARNRFDTFLDVILYMDSRKR